VAIRLQAVIDCLTAQITAIEADIQALVQSAMARDVAALRSIGGIGTATAPALLALMPELGTITGRQAAALAGVAPHPNQSGGTDRYRPIRGGRPAVKRVLFMAALAASRHNPTLQHAYQAMLARGKKPIVAIAALMRRLIVIANAVLRDARSHPAQHPSPQ
jgi:transposase